MLAFGKLTYDPNACWLPELPDRQGHAVGGVAVNFAVTAKNTGQKKSDFISITTTSTDWFDTNPGSYPRSWTFTSGRKVDAKTTWLQGPQVLPGKSRVLKWWVVFLTPFDPHYTVEIDPGGGQDVLQYEVWTNTRVC